MPEPSAWAVARAQEVLDGWGITTTCLGLGREIALEFDALAGERGGEIAGLRTSLARTFARLTCTVGALSDLTNVAEGIAECHDAIDDEERAELLHVVRSARVELALTPDALRARGEAREKVMLALRDALEKALTCEDPTEWEEDAHAACAALDALDGGCADG